MTNTRDSKDLEIMIYREPLKDMSVFILDETDLRTTYWQFSTIKCCQVVVQINSSWFHKVELELLNKWLHRDNFWTLYKELSNN
jgi:hypothetical protein